MSHPGEEAIMERIEEDIAEMSREERWSSLSNVASLHPIGHGLPL